jgi:hypothetical protein
MLAELAERLQLGELRAGLQKLLPSCVSMCAHGSVTPTAFRDRSRRADPSTRQMICSDGRIDKRDGVDGSPFRSY